MAEAIARSDDATHNESPTYRTYPIRWLVLLTIFFFNLSNNLMWISFSAVSTTAAEYYEKTIDDIDWLSSIGFFVGIPTVLIGSWAIDRFGLRICSGVGITLTFVAGIIRMATAIPGISNLGKNEQFWLCFLAQLLNGLGNPLAVSIPTKVSQNWFAGVQRVVATSILAMSSPVGVMLASCITPLIVQENPENIPIQNWVYSIPSTLTMLMFILFVRSSVPPTPPSKSAAENTSKLPYLQSIKQLITNRSYVALVISFGSLVGFFNCYATQMEQFMCSRGYSNDDSGYAVTIIISIGLVGSIIAGIITDITGKLEEVAKICNSLSCIVLALGLAQVLRKPDLFPIVAIMCTLFGLFAMGYYGIGFEISVEVTYPIDEGMGTAFIFFSGQIQGALLLLLSEVFETPLTPEALAKSTCKEYAKDHTHFLLFTAGYMTLMNVIFLLFVKTDYKRTQANNLQQDTENTDL